MSAIWRSFPDSASIISDNLHLLLLIVAELREPVLNEHDLPFVRRKVLNGDDRAVGENLESAIKIEVERRSVDQRARLADRHARRCCERGSHDAFVCGEVQGMSVAAPEAAQAISVGYRPPFLAAWITSQNEIVRANAAGG